MKILKTIFITLAVTIPLAFLVLGFEDGFEGFSILPFFAIVSGFILIKGIYDSISQRKVASSLIISIITIIILCAIAFYQALQDIKG